MYQKNKKLILFSLLLILLSAYFLKGNYKNIKNISPEILKEPVQSEVPDAKTIAFSQDGYAYKLTPLYDYKINALVVHRMDYRWFSIHNRDSIFPIDLCLIWGDNIKGGIYRDKSLSFSQDFRFCLYSWSGNLAFNQNMVSNNHLLTNDKVLEKKMEKIKTGDQVRISGFLVNVEAKKIGEVSEYDPDDFSMNSSVSRTDTAGGACEVIYVTDIKILKVGHPIWSFIFGISFYGIIILLILGVINFIKDYRKFARQHVNK